jgi:D-alanine-D-alanine ligase
MRIGLAYDLKDNIKVQGNIPDDALEEYDSPETVEGIAAALESQGHTVIRLGGGRDFLLKVTEETVDIVFNIAEGLGNYRSREAQVPSVLEMLDIPYVGADPQCLAVCLDKALTKKIMVMSGIATPRWELISNPRQLNQISWDNFPFPVFIKPAYEGSSKGIRLNSMVNEVNQIIETGEKILQTYRQPIMVEQYIDGDELTVGMIGNSPSRVLGIMKVVPRKKVKHFIYSLEVKRDWENLVYYECPARLEPSTRQAINDSSQRIMEILGCRDFARIDYKLGTDGKPYFLEINPLAGLNPRSSDLSIMAGKLGLTYEGLISEILESAKGRYPTCVHR